MQKRNSNIKFHDDIAIADTAFTIKGKNKEELFTNAAIALISSMADISKIEAREEREMKLSNEELDLLLFDFLNEILFYKDSENLLFSKFNIDIEKFAKGWKLKARVKGECASPKKHKVKTDIKAITMHLFKVEESKDGYEARVVIDI